MLLPVVRAEDLVDQAAPSFGAIEDGPSVLERPHQAEPAEGLARRHIDQVLVGRLLMEEMKALRPLHLVLLRRGTAGGEALGAGGRDSTTAGLLRCQQASETRAAVAEIAVPVVALRAPDAGIVGQGHVEQRARLCSTQPTDQEVEVGLLERAIE